MQLVTDASRPACSIAVCCAPCRRHSSTSVMSDACSFSRRAWRNTGRTRAEKLWTCGTPKPRG
eukprot:4802082-Prymnesium_polylepis.1